jgi:hypothetical protein
MREEFRLFAFDTGRQYYKDGTLDTIKLATVIKAFREKHPGQLPASVRYGITVDTWRLEVPGREWNSIAQK